MRMITETKRENHSQKVAQRLREHLYNSSKSFNFQSVRFYKQECFGVLTREIRRPNSG